MMWFSKGVASPPQFMGVQLAHHAGVYVIFCMYPDGSQNTETFDNEATLVEGARRLSHELIGRGWSLCPESRES